MCGWTRPPCGAEAPPWQGREGGSPPTCSRGSQTETWQAPHCSLRPPLPPRVDQNQPVPFVDMNWPRNFQLFVSVICGFLMQCSRSFFYTRLGATFALISQTTSTWFLGFLHRAGVQLVFSVVTLWSTGWPMGTRTISRAGY